MSHITGEAVLDADGFLHGWCWSPVLPKQPRIVEIMVNDRIVSAMFATRFREDLRERGVGDGYHGFVIPLTKSLGQSVVGCVLSVRDRASGEIFWRRIIGEFGLPIGLAERVASLEIVCKNVSQSDILWRGQAHGLKFKVATKLGQLGRYLEGELPRSGNLSSTAAQARADLVGDFEIVGPTFVAKPEVSIILDAGKDASTTIRLISSVAPALHLLKAELIILDDGCDSRNALLPSLFPSLRYIAGKNRPASILRNQAAMVARGGTLVFLKNLGVDFSQGILELAGMGWDGIKIVIPALMAERVKQFDTSITGRVALNLAVNRCGLRLAVSRNTFLKWEHSSFDEAAVALQALRDGHSVIAWQEPPPVIPNARGDLGESGYSVSGVGMTSLLPTALDAAC